MWLPIKNFQKFSRALTYSRTPRCIIGVFERPRQTIINHLNSQIMEIIVQVQTSASGKEYITLSKPSNLPGIQLEIVLPMAHSIATDPKGYGFVDGSPMPDNKSSKELLQLYSKDWYPVSPWNRR